MYDNYVENPVDRMLKCSKVMLLHQDEYLIQDTLKEISNVFKTAITWNKNLQDVKTLKDSMALFCFLSAHNMRNVRGSASETEWLEQAIYRSLGVNVSIEQNRKMVDLEAFANPLFNDFIKVYDEVVQIQL